MTEKIVTLRPGEKAPDVVTVIRHGHAGLFRSTPVVKSYIAAAGVVAAIRNASPALVAARDRINDLLVANNRELEARRTARAAIRAALDELAVDAGLLARVARARDILAKALRDA